MGIYVKENVTFSLTPQQSWFVERRRTDKNWCGRKDGNRCIETATSIHDWVSAKDCPALTPIMAELSQAREANLIIQRQRNRDHLTVAVSDTPHLSLETLANGTIRRETQSEWVGPLVEWWSAAEKRLKPCWKDSPPV